jgi:hypothetical protein
MNTSQTHGVIDRIGVNGTKVIFTLLGKSFAYTVDKTTAILCLTEKGDSVSFKHDDFLSVCAETFDNHTLENIDNL